MNDMTFWEVVDGIRAREPRYRREAYGFVMAALGVTVQGLPEERRRDPARRHLSGQELLEGVVGLARREFGQLAATVFAEWGVRSGPDVGRIVFDLVESGQLGARPEDSIEDFRHGADLLAVLRENLPIGRERGPDTSVGPVRQGGPETAA
jgi:uncharacterized repeat protein (TIGR04138 family)